jgi:hypothetical protein
MAGFVSRQARVRSVSSYASNPGNSYLSTTRNPDQTDQPCILHIPGINGTIRTEKAALLHQHIALTYLLQPTTTISQVLRT